MTISEKSKMAAVKRHIKREYAACMLKAEDTKCDNSYACVQIRSLNIGKAEAYFDCFKRLFYPDGEMTDEMLRNLIIIGGYED
jgi:hypothetical protein